jgi:probable phosphoglycerate mutase
MPAIKSTVILLVRHASTPTTGIMLPGRARGLHLSDDGRREAEATAAQIGRLRAVAAVYASPLERARETAAAIARPLGRAVRVERGLLELDIGRFTGLKLSEARKRPEWAMVQGHPSGFRFPGGESFTEMQTRITGALNRLVVRHRGRVVVAVSHADPIKAAISHALGAPLDLFQRIIVAPASITAIAYRPEGPAVLAVNVRDGNLSSLARA